MSMLRFLPGIIIIQVATAILVFAFLENPGTNWLPYGLLALIASFMTAFWFASIANHIKKDALARMKEKLLQEREQLLVSTEKEKSRVFEQTHKRIVKETNRAHAKANFKVGAAVVGAAAVGVGLLTLQFFTVGILTLLAAGGALTGYAVRARQETLKGKAAKKNLAQRKPMELIEVETSGPNPPRLEKGPRKDESNSDHQRPSG
ncbi:hypothetical protein Noc_1371 [Nitrosococcus oceani ATCC 19707]|uniref:Transmembrane protein n=2 Tax=Nitrosococcus oceani TaxID=1229 RepID=Q3JBD1_NITOC|nr:hypothetical protein [Nitrosococcus oceani]ABA57865.1 hypothetical protein Noc_1371 [Nitrosococcus oceani ATCC 19707]KFI19591.1 hypothetical protein IB75_07160 [Nitrosococcus oceani C-27]GEM19505.1 hypothetical protein NONS58_08930 [Nitrosococcus oceani]